MTISRFDAMVFMDGTQYFDFVFSQCVHPKSLREGRERILSAPCESVQEQIVLPLEVFRILFAGVLPLSASRVAVAFCKLFPRVKSRLEMTIYNRFVRYDRPFGREFQVRRSDSANRMCLQTVSICSCSGVHVPEVPPKGVVVSPTTPVAGSFLACHPMSPLAKRTATAG